jgi:hypothetical protein
MHATARTGLVAAVVAVAAVAVVAALALALVPPTRAGSDPALRLVTTRPVTVHGTGFKAHERVRLVLRKPSGAYRRRARAGPRGRFTRRFRGVTIDRCSGFRLTATGRQGSRATILRRPPLGCPPP